MIFENQVQKEGDGAIFPVLGIERSLILQILIEKSL